MTTLVYYHCRRSTSGNVIDCPDGIAAAWAVCRKYPDAELVPAFHRKKTPGQPPAPGIGAEPPSREPEPGDRVFVVDFAYDRSLMESWVRSGISVAVIDHHKSSMNQLENLSNAVTKRYDLNESGATLTWKTLFPDEPMPAFLEFVRSRDLWLDCDEPITPTRIAHEAIAKMRHEMGGGKKVFPLFDRIAELNREEFLAFCRENGGLALLEEKLAKIQAILDERGVEWKPFPVSPGGESVVVPWFVLKSDEGRLTSDLGNRICEIYPEAPFAVMPDEGYSHFEFRRRKGEGIDLGAMAQRHGGGGHPAASGCPAFEIEGE